MFDPPRRLTYAAAVSAVLGSMLVGCHRKAPVANEEPDAQMPEAGGPSIDFDARFHDFGTVTEGDTLKHVFTVKNTGTAPLLVDQVRTSCGCTVAALESKEIPPGGAAPIEVTFTTQGRPGNSRKTITVTSNDESHPSSVLEIKANVERLLDFERRALRLSTDYGTDKIQKVWLTGKLADEAKPKVSKLEGDPNKSDNAVIVKAIEEQQGDKTRRGLELKLKGNKMASGEGGVTVSTGLDEPAELTLRFTYSVTGNLAVTPDKIIVGPSSKSANREHAVRISSKRSDFRVVRVRVSEGPYETVFEKAERGDAYRIVILPKETPAGKGSSTAERKNGKVEIYSNDPIEPKKVVEILTSRPRGSGAAGAAE